MQQLNEKGFIFSSFTPDPEMRQKILNSTTPNQEIRDYMFNVLKDMGLGIKEIELNYEDVRKGNSLLMHTHLIPADYQVLFWVPDNDDFEGRGFIYGTKDNIQVFYPKFGDICFMKANDLNFIHGVEELHSESLVRTVIVNVNNRAKLGEQVTVRSSDYQVV